MNELSNPPRLATAELPGTGGRIKTVPEDFVVEELSAYDPTGAGEHLLLYVEKRALSADDLVRRVARVLEISAHDVGVAGLKDTWAVTRQWVSVPARAAPRLAALEQAEVKVLETARHHAKLRTGQLLGNRFDVLIRDPVPDAGTRAEAVIAQLQAQGLANYYGAQRFGRGGATLALGLTLLRDQPCPALARTPPSRRGFLKRLALSSVQSALFNRVLADRVGDGLLDRLLEGDVVQRRSGGGPWVVMDLAAEQARFVTREIVPTGPMFGPTMRAPRGAVLAREEAVLARAGLDRAVFTRFAKLTAGTRRALLCWLDPIAVTAEAAGLRLRFTLPPGTYATVLLAEITKQAEAAPQDDESEPETPCDP